MTIDAPCTTENEAMWMKFEANGPFMVKAYVGGVNAVSGERIQSEDATRAKVEQGLRDAPTRAQDYVVVPQQQWLDGVAVEPGVVRQFVAMPLGQGYTVEAQLTGGEVKGGLQLEITPGRVPVLETPKESKLMTIYFKTLTGHTITHCCDPSELLGDVKYDLYTMYEGVCPPAQMRLVFAGRQLEDERSLLDYNIQHVSRLTKLFVQAPSLLTHQHSAMHASSSTKIAWGWWHASKRT
jgi:hypothetical protein